MINAALGPAKQNRPAFNAPDFLNANAPVLVNRRGNFEPTGKGNWFCKLLMREGKKQRKLPAVNAV